MATFEVKAYGIECDVCGKLFEDPFSGFSIYVDEGSGKDDAREAGWLIEGNKCYCPACYEMDEDDNVIIKSDSLKENHEEREEVNNK